MQAVYILLAVVAIVVIIAIAWVVGRSEALDEWEKDLEKYSSHLDERDNRIAADEQSLLNGWRALRDAKESIDKESAVFTSTYTVTDSDLLRFETDEEIIINARKRMAQNIAVNIERHIANNVLPEMENIQGKTRYTCRVKVVEC